MLCNAKIDLPYDLTVISGSGHCLCAYNSYLREHQVACWLHVKNIGHGSFMPFHMFHVLEVLLRFRRLV